MNSEAKREEGLRIKKCLGTIDKNEIRMYWITVMKNLIEGIIFKNI